MADQLEQLAGKPSWLSQQEKCPSAELIAAIHRVESWQQAEWVVRVTEKKAHNLFVGGLRLGNSFDQIARVARVNR